MRAAVGLALALGLVMAPASQADVYRWVDANGRAHFTTELHEVPASERAAAEQAAAAPAKQGPTLQTFGTGAAGKPLRAPVQQARRATRAATVYTVQVERAGTSLIVPVRLNDRVVVPFLIDTGASDVLLPQSVADQLGIKIGPDTRRVRYSTANGVVENPVVMLDAVDLGGARVEGVPASVSPSLGIGLLGLSFFNHFTYEVDAAEGVVRLRPNQLAEQGLIRGGRSQAQWRTEFGSLEGRRREVEDELGGTQGSRGRERARLTSLISDLDRDLGVLSGEADQARVPEDWRR